MPISESLVKKAEQWAELMLARIHQHRLSWHFYYGMMAAEKGETQWSYGLGLNELEREQFITGHYFFRWRRIDLRDGRESALTAIPLPPCPKIEP